MVLAKISLIKEDRALTDNVWISMSHAINHPDLNPEDYNIWLEMWQQMYQTKFHNAKELSHHMLGMQYGLKQSVINDAFGHHLCIIDDAQLMSVVNIPMHVFM